VTDLDGFLERNQEFANRGGHQNPVSSPGRRVIIVTCVDPRVDPAHFMGVGLGEAIVIRNTGGRVTDDVIADVMFLVARMEKRAPDGVANLDVAVIHHTDCGTKLLADPDFRGALASRLGIDEAPLAERSVTDPAESVRHDVEAIRESPAVPDGVAVSGHVYDVETGLVTTVVPAGS
jgi:carbonic anhydrase